MSKFIITKPIDFGNFTILDKNGCPLCQVPINNYAPPVGSTVEGELETKPISDGNGHTEIKTGITYWILTNGSASTQGQTSVQFITEDHLSLVDPNNNNGSGSGAGSNSGAGTTTTSGSWASSASSDASAKYNNWSTSNILSGLTLIAGVILVIWGAAKIGTDKENKGIMYIIIGGILVLIHIIFPVKIKTTSKS